MNQSNEKLNLFGEKEFSGEKEKYRLTIEKFFRGEEIYFRKPGVNLEVFWAGCYYSVEVSDEFSIDKNVLIRDILKGNFIHYIDIAGNRVILKDSDNGHLICHAY